MGGIHVLHALCLCRTESGTFFQEEAALPGEVEKRRATDLASRGVRLTGHASNLSGKRRRSVAAMVAYRSATVL